MLEVIVITALVITTVLLALRKMGVLDWYGARFGHIPWLPASSCFLCLGFWMAAVTWFPFAGITVYSGDYLDGLKFILIPFASTAISTLITHEIINN